MAPAEIFKSLSLRILRSSTTRPRREGKHVRACLSVRVFLFFDTLSPLRLFHLATKMQIFSVALRTGTNMEQHWIVRSDSVFR